MTELSVELVVAAPAGRATPSAVPNGGTRPPQAVAVDAPVAGRVCRTGIRMVPEVTETLIAYDDANRTLTYQASGMPAFVTLARNTWTVIPIDAGRCRVSLCARFDTRGLLGLLGRWAILAQTRRTSRHLADDLRHYAETGTPSPRKQRHIDRAEATS